MSGLSSLVLKVSEIGIVALQYKDTLMKLQKLHDKTPEPVIFYLAGYLPGVAVLHMRQLSLLGMIARLQGSVLHQHATNILTSAKSSSIHSNP